MRAVALESVPSAPAVTEVDTPRPEAGELLVKVAAASLNGIDIAAAADYTQAALKPFLGAGSLAEYVAVPAEHGVARVPAGQRPSPTGSSSALRSPSCRPTTRSGSSSNSPRPRPSLPDASNWSPGEARRRSPSRSSTKTSATTTCSTPPNSTC